MKREKRGGDRFIILTGILLGFISLAFWIDGGGSSFDFSFPVVVERPVRGCVLGGAEQERLKREFMSAEFVLEGIGALHLFSFPVVVERPVRGCVLGVKQKQKEEKEKEKERGSEKPEKSW